MNALEEQLETWRPVIGYEGRYEVSDEGRIRSLNFARKGFIKILKLGINRDGYNFVSLPNDNGGNRRKQFRVHSLVSEAFIGPRPEKHDVNHKNGVKLDNRLSNLEYCTESQNTKHSFENGLQDPIVGSDHYRAKLNEDMVWVIRELFRLGIRANEIALIFDIKPKHARKIKSGIIWKHVKS